MGNVPRKRIVKFLGIFILATATLHMSRFHQAMKVTQDKNATSKSIERKSAHLLKLQWEGQTHINDCVPHYEQLLRGKNSSNGYREQNETSLSLIASYDYRTYSVVTIQADGLFGRAMYCRYFDKDRQEIQPPVESFVFPEFAVHCCSRANAYYMGVTYNLSSIITEHVPVIDRRSDEPKYLLSLCLAPMYGNERKWLLLAELIEHYKMHGVDHFYIYVKDMDDYTLKLIRHYEISGIAEVIFFRKYNDRPGKEWQLAGNEDCLQRSRHHSRYAIFHDLDERIVPTGNVTIRCLIKQTMESNSTIAMMAFAAQRVERTFRAPLEYKENHTLKRHLPTLVFHKANRRMWAGRHPKCVVDPRRVLLMWVHHVELYFPGYKGCNVALDKAILRHYRDLTRALPKRRLRHIAKWHKYIVVDYPTELMPILYSNVEATLNHVYGSVKY